MLKRNKAQKFGIFVMPEKSPLLGQILKTLGVKLCFFAKNKENNQIWVVVMINNEGFVANLTCEELCVLSKKKSYYDTSKKGGKIGRLARIEMSQRLCEPC